MPAPSPRPRSTGWTGPVGRLLHWSPVWIPAALVVQFATLGLRPALAERERLEEARPEVVARHERTRARFERLAAERAAWEDPVYRERLRRLRTGR